MRSHTICQAIDYGGPTGGSFIPALQSLAHALVNRGDRFVVFASDIPGATWPGELTLAGAEVRIVRDAPQLIAGLRRVDADVVHSHFTRFDLASLSMARRAKVVWHVHSHREDLSLTAKVKAYAKYRVAGAKVSAVVAVSQAVQKESIAWYAAPDRVHVIYNGIDTVRFRPPENGERAAARAAFGLRPEDRVVLFFERVPYKGGALLRQARPLLGEHRLLVAGGSKEDRDRFGTDPSVIALERVADARLLYWAADALAFASNAEAFGYVIAEALACGVPVAASDIPVVHELCDGIDSVYLFRVGDPAGLAAALESALACTRTERGRARAIDRFSLDRWTRDTVALYDSVL